MHEKIKNFFLSANKYIKEKSLRNFEFYISPGTIVVTKEIDFLGAKNDKERAIYANISKRTSQILSDSVQEFSFSNLPQKLDFFFSRIENLRELYVPSIFSFDIDFFDKDLHIETIELPETKLLKNEHLKEIEKLTEEGMAISFNSSLFFIPVLHEHRTVIKSLFVLIGVTYEVSSFIWHEAD